MTFASHVVITASLYCHISIRNIHHNLSFFFFLTWYKHISDSIVWFHCISMKNIFLREVACFAGLASDNSNMSTWSSHPCFTTRVIYEHETGGCEVMFAMVYIIEKYHPLGLIHATYRFLLHIFVPNCLVIHLSPKQKLRQEHLCSYRLVRNFVHIDAYRCKTLLILVVSSNTKHLLCIHPQPIENVVETTLQGFFLHFPEYRPLDCERESNRARKNFVRARQILKLRARWARAARGLMSSGSTAFGMISHCLKSPTL